MENFNGQDESADIFNLQPDSFINPIKPKAQSFYQPQADEGREGVYKAVVRFLPFHKNPNKSKIQKYYVWINNVVDGEAFSVDCPSTVGKKSILKDTYWKLKNSQSASEQALAENFSRAENFYSLVQVVKDPNKPELEGKVMVFKFGKKINDKIEAQLKPLVGNPCNPYDLFEGKLFALHITKKQKWNNYDSCEFVGDKCALQLPGESAPISKTKEDMGRVLSWLKENSPELDKYEYKDWTDEVTEKVHRAIKNIIPDGRLVEQILSSAQSDRPSTGVASVTSYAEVTPKASVTTQSSIDAVSNVEQREPAKTAKTEKAAGNVGIDDLYEGL
jgi:hypothetical protein